MKQLLQEISDLIQEKEDSKKEFEQSGNWCHPSIPPMSETQFDEKLRGLINHYVKRLAKQAYEGA
jgi:hypothetical protein